VSDERKITYEEARELFLVDRGVSVPCARCSGNGCYMYPNTATWRGGIGGQAITRDVCDECWGTGCQDRKGTDLRKLRDEAEKRVADRVTSLMTERLGLKANCIRETVLRLADDIEALGAKRTDRRAGDYAIFAKYVARILRGES